MSHSVLIVDDDPTQRRLIEGVLEKNGLIFSGRSPDHPIMQIIELPTDQHPFFMATQAHPWFLRGVACTMATRIRSTMRMIEAEARQVARPARR